MSLQTFFANFVLLADAPNGVVKLRELILQLAVQGELTQDWRKKQSYSKEETWKSVDFFSFCILQRGYDLPLSTREDGHFPIVTSAGIAAYHSEFKAKAPGVVVGRSGSIGKVFYIEEDFWAHNTTLYVKDFKGNLPKYVYYYLLNFKAQQFSRSTAVPTLNRNHLRGFVVDVPSYEEQKQIVKRIEELLRLCDELEARQQARRESRVRLNNATLAPLSNASSLTSEEFEKYFTRLADNFATLYDSAETVGNLRSTILQLSLRGCLVPRDPSDEPASELLKRILIEKLKLSKDKKPREAKPANVIESDEPPFVLPPMWTWVRLGELCKLENGDRSKNYPSRNEFVPEGMPFINAGHLQSGRICMDSMNYIPESRFNLLKSGKVQDGDILFCLRGSLGKSALVSDISQGAIASSLVIMRPIGNLNRQFILNYLFSPLVTYMIKRFDNGTAQPNLSSADLGKFLFPLAPFAEQNRIVAKVNQLMALCDELESKLRQTKADSEKLMKAAVRDLLSSIAGQEKSQRETALALSSV